MSVLPTRRAPRPSGSGVRNGGFEAAADNGNIDFVYSFATWVMEVAEVGSAQTADRPRRRDHACRRRRRFLGPNPSHTPHTGPGSRRASSAGHARRNALPLPGRRLRDRGHFPEPPRDPSLSPPTPRHPPGDTQTSRRPAGLRTTGHLAFPSRVRQVRSRPPSAPDSPEALQLEDSTARPSPWGS